MQNHVLDYLDATVKRVPDKLAFADEEVQYTFRELDTIIKNTASCLAEKGYYKEPVIVFMKKSPRTIATFFSIIDAGCFYVPIDEEMPAARINLILENCKPRVLICDDAMREAAEKLTFTGEILSFENVP